MEFLTALTKPPLKVLWGKKFPATARDKTKKKKKKSFIRQLLIYVWGALATELVFATNCFVNGGSLPAHFVPKKPSGFSGSNVMGGKIPAHFVKGDSIIL